MKDWKQDIPWWILLALGFTIFGFVAGMQISLFDDGALQAAASFGDALNPWISLLSAILVFVGLVYTIRDFRLARTEFKASTEQLAKANEIELRKLSAPNVEAKLQRMNDHIQYFLKTKTKASLIAIDRERTKAIGKPSEWFEVPYESLLGMGEHKVFQRYGSDGLDEIIASHIPVNKIDDFNKRYTKQFVERSIDDYLFVVCLHSPEYTLKTIADYLTAFWELLNGPECELVVDLPRERYMEGIKEIALHSLSRVVYVYENHSIYNEELRVGRDLVRLDHLYPICDLYRDLRDLVCSKESQSAYDRAGLFFSSEEKIDQSIKGNLKIACSDNQLVNILNSLSDKEDT